MKAMASLRAGGGRGRGQVGGLDWAGDEAGQADLQDQGGPVGVRGLRLGVRMGEACAGSAGAAQENKQASLTGGRMIGARPAGETPPGGREGWVWQARPALSSCRRDVDGRVYDLGRPVAAPAAYW